LEKNPARSRKIDPRIRINAAKQVVISIVIESQDLISFRVKMKTRMDGSVAWFLGCNGKRW
jgi:hypothetical protein